jgi:hypothetical protein
MIGRIARALVGRQKHSRRKRSKAVIGGSLGLAGLVFRRETPDGRVIGVAFQLPRRVWQAKESGGAVLYEARSLRDAVAAACGYDPDASWVQTLEAEITAASSTASEIRPRQSRRGTRVVRAVKSPLPENRVDFRAP